MSLYRVNMRVVLVVHGKDADEALAIAEAIQVVDGIACQVTLDSIGPVTRLSDLPAGIDGDCYAGSAWEYKDLPEGKQKIKYWLDLAGEV